MRSGAAVGLVAPLAARRVRQWRRGVSPYWAVAGIGAAAVGVTVGTTPSVAFGLVGMVLAVALAGELTKFRPAFAFAGCVLATSALVDLPGKVHSGRFTANAGVTVVYACLGLIFLVRALPEIHPWAFRPLRFFAALFGFAVVSLSWSSPSVPALQNLMVLLVFVVAAASGIVASVSEAIPGSFAARTFPVASVVALALYGASVFAGGIGSGAVVGNRSFALFGLLIVAWGAAGWRDGARFARLLALASGLLILLSLSRTAIAAALIVCCLASLNPRSVPGWTRFLGALGIALGAVYLAISNIPALHSRIFKGDLQSIGGGVSINVEGRAQLWSATWRSFLKSPYFGHGVGTADRLIQRIAPPAGHPHDDYLRILHDYGLFGMCLWGVGYAWLVLRTWRAWQMSKTNVSPWEVRHQGMSEKNVHGAAFLALVAAALAMVTDNVIDYLFVMGPLGVLVGLSLGADLRERRSMESSAAQRPKTSPRTRQLGLSSDSQVLWARAGRPRRRRT